MCDYYAFACRFQCLPETHHFSPNWISYIVAYIWLITNDGIPSRYKQSQLFQKVHFYINSTPHNDIAKIPPKKSLQISTQYRPVSPSHYT